VEGHPRATRWGSLANDLEPRRLGLSFVKFFDSFVERPARKVTKVRRLAFDALKFLFLRDLRHPPLAGFVKSLGKSISPASTSSTKSDRCVTIIRASRKRRSRNPAISAALES
jgi:hypothetical protein